MVRKARFNLPGIPQHLIQRGNNREPIPPHRINASRYYVAFKRCNGSLTPLRHDPHFSLRPR